MLISALLASFCFFVPPKGWQCAQPKNLSPYVQVGFIAEAESGFCPSINFAIEEIDVPLKEYLKAVKEIHSEEAGTKWRDLGKFSMEGGEGRLTEICGHSPWGPTKMLQAFLVRDDKAYILTAAVLQKEFLKYQKEILASLKTLQVAEDLFSPIQNEADRNALKKVFTSLRSCPPEERKMLQAQLEKAVTEMGESLGTHWQFLVLKEGITKLYATQP